MSNIRLRFAPSPTGALHIGGLRTALYNYLLARQTGGAFILRIEDTDQTRYVEGAEDYIKESLKWFGLEPDEGPGYGGDYGPYRQSERKDQYQVYAQQLLDNGQAYYAFDTPEELTAMRDKAKEAGNHAWRYDANTRMDMRNSLSLAASETDRLLAADHPYVLRLKVNPGQEIHIQDLVRGEVTFSTDELDDKVMLKADGLPTYHLANIVDDHLMQISHVIRGEEWLPSTAHHILLYRALKWEDTMPKFAHLPLILKPSGKGKLSKRDGAKLGIPVFPLDWHEPSDGSTFLGFREFGFLPEAATNFLAMLGWNPGTEQEMFSQDELIKAFSVERIGKSGARFDFTKALWFNQQYIIAAPKDRLINLLRPLLASKGISVDDDFLTTFIELLRERVETIPDFWTKGAFFFEVVSSYDEKMVRKKWKPERRDSFEDLRKRLAVISDFTPTDIKTEVEAFMADTGLKYGDVLPIFRLAMSGSTSGPDAFGMVALMGQEKVNERLTGAYDLFDNMKQS